MLKYVGIWHYCDLFRFAVLRIITSPGGQTMECVVFYSEKQVSVARFQPLELFSNVFIQVFLSLLATVVLVFGVNKTLWHGL